MESVHKGVKDILNYVKNWIPSGPVDGKLSEVQKAGVELVRLCPL